MAFGVSGSGEAKISASRIAFNSALAFMIPHSQFLISSSVLAFRIADRVGRIRGPRSFVHANRPKAPRLKDPDQLQADHFQKSDEGHDESGAIVHVRKQLLEAASHG